MKARSSMRINGRQIEAGDELPMSTIYPFFMVHMLMFGGSGFLMAYGGAPVAFLYVHGGGASLIYVIFYLTIFGRDEVKWMFINAGLGILGILSQMDWILSLFDKQMSDFPWYVHVIPCFYFVLYTFLLHNAVLDLFGVRDSPVRRKLVDTGYVVVLVVSYLISFII